MKSKLEYEVLEGTMKFRIGRKTIIAKAGDVVTVPAGKAPKLENGGVRTAFVQLRVAP